MKQPSGRNPTGKKVNADRSTSTVVGFPPERQSFDARVNNLRQSVAYLEDEFDLLRAYPRDLLEQSLEAECYAGLRKPMPGSLRRNRPVQDLQIQLERAFVASEPYENYPNKVYEAARARDREISFAATASRRGAKQDGSSQRTRRAAASAHRPRAMSATLHLLLGVFAGVLAAGAIAASISHSLGGRGATGATLRNWSLSGPIVVEIPDAARRLIAAPRQPK